MKQIKSLDIAKVQMLAMRLGCALRAATKAHDARCKVPYSGYGHFNRENKAIMKIRRRADRFLLRFGFRPYGWELYGNDKVQKLLDTAATASVQDYNRHRALVTDMNKEIYKRRRKG